MSIEVLEPEQIEEEKDGLDPESGGIPPLYGRCPVCNKPLFPRDRYTGQMKAPPVGTGYESRAKCGGCGNIICYVGSGNWRLLSDADITDEDVKADAGA